MSDQVDNLEEAFCYVASGTMYEHIMYKVASLLRKRIILIFDVPAIERIVYAKSTGGSYSSHKRSRLFYTDFYGCPFG
jgi:hypothetical protein